MVTNKRKGPTIRSHLVVRLREGWTFTAGSRRFTKEGHAPVCPGDDLPRYTRIRFQVPELARKRRRTKAEDELARGIQIVPPKDVPPDELLELVRSWPCVEKAWVSPEISPPSISVATPSRAKGGRRL
jgi:hypothetical protein